MLCKLALFACLCAVTLVAGRDLATCTNRTRLCNGDYLW